MLALTQAPKCRWVQGGSGRVRPLVQMPAVPVQLPRRRAGLKPLDPASFPTRWSAERSAWALDKVLTALLVSALLLPPVHAVDCFVSPDCMARWGSQLGGRHC